MLWVLAAFIVFAAVVFGLNYLDNRANGEYNENFMRLRRARRLIQQAREADERIDPLR